MIFKSIIILCVAAISITSGYRTDCSDSEKKCYITMSPFEHTYLEVFLASLPTNVLTSNLEIDKYDYNDFDINTANQRLKDSVDQDTMRKFYKNLTGNDPKYSTYVKLVKV
uniref:Secreted protein n=1 Tax=Strongyloides papillosus TaxID=174720 RepID=A0A0N5BU11_STREA